MHTPFLRVLLCAMLGLAGAHAWAGEKLRASEVLKMAVVDSQGARLGAVEDLVVDLERGLVRAVVVERGAKLHAHSIASLSLAPSKKSLALQVPHGAVKEAIGFDRSRWPAFSDPYWAMMSPQPGGLPAPAGGVPYPKDARKAAPQLARASELIGAKVDDIVFDLETGAVQSAHKLK